MDIEIEEVSMIRRLMLFIALVALSCAGQSQVRAPKVSHQQPGMDRIAQVVLYAKVDDSEVGDFDWKVRKVALSRSDGTQASILDSGTSITSSEFSRYQGLLTVSDFPPGKYDALTIFTEKIVKEGSSVAFPMNTAVLTLDHHFDVIAGKAKTITMHVSMKKDPEVSGGVRPVIRIEDENPLPTGELIYVANEISSNLSIIDKKVGHVVYNVFVGTTPYALSADHRRNRLYIADRKEGVIYELDMNTQHLVRATQLDYVDEPVHIEPIPSKDLIVVVNYGTDTIHLIDAFSLQVTSTVEVGDGPLYAVYSAANDRVFVLNEHFGTLSVVDVSSEEPAIDTTLTVEMQPVSMAIDDNKDWLYITNSGSTDLTVINIEKLGVEKTITIGMGASDMVFDPFGRRIYVSMRTSKQVICIDPYTDVVLYAIDLESTPGHLLFDSVDKRLYVTLPELNGVAVIDPMKRNMEDWIETGYRPQALAERF